MKIKEIRGARPDFYVKLDDGQVFHFLLREILDFDSNKNRLMKLMTGESVGAFWFRHTVPVWQKGEPGEVISLTDSPVKIFLPGIDFT
jgi:hypothetical protein